MFYRFNSLRVFAALLLVLPFFCSLGSRVANAQTAGAGSITGTVMDPNSSVLPAAVVTVTNTDTGVEHAFSTNSAGIYVAPFLQPGHYKVTATGAGFGKVQASGLTLLVGQTLTIDLTLTVQSTTTTVEVSSATPILDIERTEVSQAVDQAIIQNLPVNGRNWSDFVLLTPNVVQDGGSGLVSFHGISGLYNQNYVDGANNNQMLFSEARGRSSGAPFRVQPRLHQGIPGRSLELLGRIRSGRRRPGERHHPQRRQRPAWRPVLLSALSRLNALDPISKWSALYNHGNPFLLTQPVHQQQEFGGSVGGPIKKDKLFYFLTSDNFRRTGRALYYETNTVSQTPTGSYTDTTTVSPTQCPATISSAQCTAAIGFLLNLQAAPRRFARETLVFPRVDYQLNEKNLVYANFNFADFDQSYGYSPTPRTPTPPPAPTRPPAITSGSWSRTGHPR